MKVFIKPIQFTDIKEELEVSIDPRNLVGDLVNEIKNMIGDEYNIHFLFRGKKLINEKGLVEQGIKENTKLLMYKSDISVEKSKEVINHKEIAKNKLLEMGYKLESIEPIIRTLINLDQLNHETIVEKSLFFLKNMNKETTEDVFLEVQEKDSLIEIDENRITSIFTMGNGIQGQLGVGKYIKTDFPLRVNKLRQIKIKTIACGVYHSTALADNGYGIFLLIYLVYFWGRYFGRIESGNTDYKTGDNPFPILIESLTNEIIIEVFSIFKCIDWMWI